MSDHWIDPNSCPTLAVLVESVAGPLLMQHTAPIALEMDVRADLDVPADPVRTADLVRTLVKQAIDEMPDGGDLTVTACETAHGIELEMADTGSDIEQRAQRLPLAAAAIGAQLVWQNCPQGGAAVTVTFRRQSGQGRIAA
jgi:hypothetical protein